MTPPLVDESTPYSKNDNKYLGANEKSKRLPSIYKSISNKFGLNFLDITNLAKTGEDGIHMTEESHNRIGILLSKLILQL